MGRLIDADILIAELKESASHHCNNPREDSLLQRDRVIVRAQPTVEAIPKAEIKKFLEEGTKDVSNKVLAIVREDYIHKSVYEARLKADLKAILVELQLEIEELYPEHQCSGELTGFADAIEIITPIIQQKINELKAECEGKK